MGKLLDDRKRICRMGSNYYQTLKTWESNGVNETAKVVCEECNNGWMSDIESKHAEPAMRDLILSNASVCLTPERIRSIAIFGFKTAVIGNAMENKQSLALPRTVFSPASLRRFRTSLTIPQGVQVWLGCLDANGIHDALMRRRYAKAPVGMPNGFKFYACTFGIGNFIMQVVATEWTKGAFRRRSSPNFTQASDWNDYAIPVWPLSGRSVIWPPPKPLEGHGVDAFSDRWVKFEVRPPIL